MDVGWRSPLVASMAAVQEIMLSSGSIAPTSLANHFWRHKLDGLYGRVRVGLCYADSISRERREGTLGILLLTRLKTFDVVLGKLCSAGTTTYYALFGFAPHWR